MMKLLKNSKKNVYTLINIIAESLEVYPREEIMNNTQKKDFKK